MVIQINLGWLFCCPYYRTSRMIKWYHQKNYEYKNLCAISLFRLAIIPIGEYNDNQG